MERVESISTMMTTVNTVIHVMSYSHTAPAVCYPVTTSLVSTHSNAQNVSLPTHTSLAVGMNAYQNVRMVRYPYMMTKKSTSSVQNVHTDAQIVS